MEITLRGIGVSPGVAIGPAVTFHVQTIDVPRYSIEDPTAELERFDAAVMKVRETLTMLYDQTADELDERHAGIFKAHIAMIEDLALRSEIASRLKDERVNVEYLVEDEMSKYTRVLEKVDDPQFRERAIDLVDVGKRILGKLLNRELESLEHLDHPCVVVAHDLSPAETANMDLTNTLALVTDSGGPTSHMAILARAFEIPAVVGLRFAGSRIAPDDTVVVDGSSGTVIIRPHDLTLADFEEEKDRYEADQLALVKAESDGPSATLDGQEIPTLANIELPMEAGPSLKTKSQGIGLYRTEYLFLNRASLPGEEEQYRAYTHVLEAMNPAPVTIRTLDMGGDKLLPHVTQDGETNPQLGWRSIRLCLDRPDIFKAQLRALFRASVHGNLRVMFPFISGVEELREALTVVEQVRDDLEKRGVPFDENVQIGTMIEVPAAVAVADRLAKEVSFFSVGTNDLIQYCLAVDRVNERTAHLYQPGHPAVLRMLKQTIDAATKAEIPCSICGEMAGHPLFTELLLGMGFRSLSMSAVSLPIVRAEIANTRLTTAKRFARKVLNRDSVSEVKALLSQRYKTRDTMKPYRRPKKGPGGHRRG